MSYIAHLLRHPDREFHALNLSSGGETPEDQDLRAEARTAEAALTEGLGDAGEMLDSAAKANYRQSLKDLRAELDEAEQFNDCDRADKVRAEIDFIEGELSRAVGLAWRDRRAASASERARLKATPAIKAAVARIAQEDAARGRLLHTTIQTGTFCSYTPDARFRINWQL
jgi:non-specific serine/threonine protein kinase